MMAARFLALTCLSICRIPIIVWIGLVMSRFTMALENLLPDIRYSRSKRETLYHVRKRDVLMKVGLSQSTGTF